MRFLVSLFALLFSVLTPSWGQTVPFPPSPKQLVAVNPVTNKVYVANEFANTVTVIDQASNTSTTIPVGNRPQFIVVNPLTNRIFVNNGQDASLTVIDGNTDTPVDAAFPVGSQGPMAINAETNIVYIVRMTSVATDEVSFFNANNNTWYTIATESFQPTALTVNPVTNTLYVAHYGTGDVRVISAQFNNTNLHPATTSIGAWSKPFAVAANSVTNKIYVITEDSRGPIGVIDGATNNDTWLTPTAGHAASPKALAVNPVTNKIYAAFAGEVIVIDGSNNSLSYVPVTTGTTASIAINYFTNKIYVSGDGGNLTVIDGATNATTSLSVPAGTLSIGVNPTTNEVIAGGGTPTVVDGVSAAFGTVPVTTTITPLAGNSSAANGAITMNAANSFANALPVRGVYYQFDSIDGRWTLANGSGNGPWMAPLSGLSSGAHTIYAFAAEAHTVPTDTGNGSSPLIGNIASYAFSVTSGSSAVNVASSQNPSTVGQSVTFTATVSGGSSTPTGTVGFVDGTTTLCSAVTLSSSGVATCTTSALTAGTHTITANYSGDSSHASASSSVTQTVNKLASNVAVGSTPNPSTSGQTVTITATVTGSSGTPTGTVNFLDGTTALCSSVALSGAGTATCSTSSLSTGAHTINVNYSGNTTYSTGTGSATQNVGVAASSTSVVSSVNPSLAGQSVTFTATVSASGATPTGTVTFSDGATAVCSAVALASGSAACTTTALAAGAHTITATYSGSGTYGGSSGTVSQTVNKRVATVTGSASPTTAGTGEAVTLTAVLSGGGAAPTGTVDFLEGTTAVAGCSARPISGDRAICTISTLSTGTHTLTARYSGDAAYNTATSASFSVTVDCTTCPPPTPTLTSPTGTITTQTPTFVWTGSAKATSYRVIVQNLNGVAVDTIVTPAQVSCAAGGTCSFNPNVTLASGNWAWFVKAFNSYGESAWTDGMGFTVAGPAGPSAPAAPMPSSPSGTITTASPTFTWTASAGATSYWLLVQNLDSVAVNREVSASEAGCASGGTCSFKPNVTLRNANWSWFLKAINAAGESPWNDGMGFKVSVGDTGGGTPPTGTTPPSAPMQSSPNGTITSNNPTYVWSASAGATSYWLLVQNLNGVAVNRAVSASEAGCSSGGTCSFSPNVVLTNANWGWFVKAFNSAGESPWSNGMGFTVNAGGGGTATIPNAPTLISPSGNISTTTPTYTWNASAGATSYYIVVQNTTSVAVAITLTAAQVGCAGGTGVCSYTPSAALPRNTPWNWFVRAINSAGESSYSAGMSFRTPS